MIVHLDTKDWITPGRFAKTNKVSKQVVNNWIARGKIESRYIKEWNLRLIRKTEEPDVREKIFGK